MSNRLIIFLAFFLCISCAYSQGFTDSNNSTTRALGAAGEFVGSVKPVEDYSMITTMYFTDQPGSIVYEFSSDKINYDYTKTFALEFDVSSNRYMGFVYHVPVSKYFRIHYINDATPQSVFRLHTVYNEYKHICNDSILVSVSSTDTVFVEVTDTTIVQVTDTTVVKLDVNAENYFFWNLHRGSIPRGRIEHITAVNDSIGTNPSEILWPHSTGITFIEDSDGEFLRIASGGAAQDSVFGGGAWTVELEYLDTNWVETLDTLITSGTSISVDSSKTKAIRLNKARVLASGGYGDTNLGDILIEGANSGDPLGLIDSLQGKTQQGIFTCPAATSCYATNITIQVTGSTSVNLNLYTRPSADLMAGPPYKSPESELRYFSLGGGSNVTVDSDEIIPFSEKTDLWWQAYSNSGNASATVTFDVILIQ